MLWGRGLPQGAAAPRGQSRQQVPRKTSADLKSFLKTAQCGQQTECDDMAEPLGADVGPQRSREVAECTACAERNFPPMIGRAFQQSDRDIAARGQRNGGGDIQASRKPARTLHR